MPIAEVWALSLPVLVTAGAFTDIFSYRIPNVLTAAAVPTFFVYAALAEMSGAELLAHVLFGTAMLLITMVAFYLGCFGGGDAKMLAATGLWLSPQEWTVFLLYTATAGLVFALLLIVLRTLPLPPGFLLNRYLYGLYAGNEGNRLAVPYGVAIAVGILALPCHVMSFA